MKMVRILALLVVLTLVLAGAAAFVLYSRVDEPFRGYEGEAQELEIAPGSGTRAIGDKLVAAGIVRDVLTYRVALWLSGDARRLKAGEYRFDRPMNAREVLGKIARGEVDLVNVTFREGLTIAEMAAIFEAQGLGSASSFREAASDAALVRDIDRSAMDLEGYLFPETYAVSRHVKPQQLVRAMVERFTHVLTPDLRDAASARGLCPAARDARFDRRKGNRCRGRAPASRRGVQQPVEDRYGPAVRSDGDLRAAAGRQVRREPQSG